MITLSHLNKSYDKTVALRDINLTVERGEIVGVIGQSGAGKSTLIRCVNLLERPCNGTVTVDGQELTSLSASALRTRRHSIGMIFQHFNLLSSKTVYENIALPLRLAKNSEDEIRAAITPLLALTGLNNKKESYPLQLSGGQKQRVAIARALASKPNVLLCDEATSALDPHTTQTILKLLQQINQELGVTILLITHEMDVVKQICDKVALLEQGEIIEQSDTLRFFSEPQTSIAKDLVSGALKQALPSALVKKIKEEPAKNPLLRIVFHGRSAAEPLVSHLIQTIGLEMNILQANIEFIKDEALGVMVLEVSQGQEHLEKGIHYLKEKQCHVEVIGYVA